MALLLDTVRSARGWLYVCCIDRLDDRSRRLILPSTRQYMLLSCQKSPAKRLAGTSAAELSFSRS